MKVNRMTTTYANGQSTSRLVPDMEAQIRSNAFMGYQWDDQRCVYVNLHTNVEIKFEKVEM